MITSLVSRLRDAIPSPRRRELRWWLRRIARPAVMGTINGVTPVSRRWGSDRGTPVDRHYIEAFLKEHGADVRGRVLEIMDSSYTSRFGVDVERIDVLDMDPDNRHATIVADLSQAGNVPSDQFDCFVLTQTLQFILDLRGALAHAHRILRPGGVLLATVPAVSRIDDNYADYWRLTARSAEALFEDAFGPGQVTVRSYGNVLAAVAFLHGIASEELSPRKLHDHDPLYPVLVTVRAVKA
jgi:SAM-dependent methyltransferase